MFSAFQVRVTVGAWDGEWIWYVSRSVKPPSRNAKSKPKENGIASGLAMSRWLRARRRSSRRSRHPWLATPLDVSGSGTPLLDENGNTDGGNGANGCERKPSPGAVSRALLERAVRTTEPNGAFSILQPRCKQGRITIPSVIVLAANGFYAAPKSASTTSASTSTHGAKSIPAPTPYWTAVRTVT
ncbi:hypothetical protein K438DRAFT_1987311 [Mycena galopus ATCC 62051]|nr:hypothetical protein K438DRAFT_1987311 [Mycena galopus ATCC 62051]